MQEKIAILDQRPTTNDQRPTTNDQRPTTNDPIHVALAVCDPTGTYSQHAGVTITSIFENTKSKVIVHILHDETLTEDNRKKFIRTAEKYNQTIELIDVSECAKQISDELAKLSENWTIGTLYRMFIPDVLPSIEKIIYLDCDILVNLDICELWDLELGENCLAGVLDEGIYKAQRFSYYYFMCKINGCISSLYINGGVLLMNLKRLREFGDILKISEEWISHHRHSSKFIDQDIINSVFIDSIKRIDKKFNIHTNLYDDDLSRSIIHPIWQKPWKQFENSEPVQIYWNMYLRSAWGENVTPRELIKKLSIISDTMKHSFKQCLRRVVATIWKRVTFIEKREIIKLILTDTFYRLKYKLSR